MATRNELERWDRDHLWHPFTPAGAAAPLVIARGDGVYLYDLDGNAYIDATASMWCNVHGHRVPELDDAIRDQLDRVAHSTLLGLSNVPAIELARRLVEVTPVELTRVFYSDDGATAVEIALKMAFQYWSYSRPTKTKFLALHGAYHGDTLGDVSVGDIGRFHSLFAPLLFETYRAPSPYCYRCPLGLERRSCATDCVGELERLVATHADGLAAVVIEPAVQGAAGMITQPPGYLRRVREVTQKHDVLLILDEVAVGFGRTGAMFACEHEHVSPDFLCLAKGLTGGYLPLAATLTTEAVFAAFVGKTFFHGHTYTGNPLGCAVSLASLDLLQRRVMPELPAKIARLNVHLDRLAELGNVGEVRRMGLLAGVELVRDRAIKEPFPAEWVVGRRVCDEARRRGVLLRPLRDTIVVMPPLAIDAASLDRIGEVLFDSIAAVMKELGA